MLEDLCGTKAESDLTDTKNFVETKQGSYSQQHMKIRSCKYE